MSNYFSRWCELCESDSIKAITDMLIKDQILKLIPIPLVNYLKENRIFNVPLEKVITLAENFQSIHGITDSGKSTSNLDFPVATKDKPNLVKTYTVRVESLVIFLVIFLQIPIGKIKMCLDSKSISVQDTNSTKVANLRFRCGRSGHYARFL